MSRKIQDFFKAIPQKKALESIKGNKIHQEKSKSHSDNFQDCRMVLDEKIINDNAESREKTKKLSHNCKICHKKLSYSSKLLDHMKYVHPEQLKDLLECHICQRKFITKKALELHVKVKHFYGKLQLFECDFCGKSTTFKGKMYQHMKVHLPTVNCDICHVELKQSSIKYHMKEIHESDRKFQCKMCPKMLKTKGILRTHQKTHDKKFQCTKCIKTFPTKFYLSKHQKEVHENPGSYSCEICGKKFNEKGNLKVHQKIHERNRPKPLKCERCYYETNIKTNYERHMKSHQRQDEKFAAMKNPLKCPKCPNLCRNKNALSEHLKHVHSNEPFQCDLCGRYLKTMPILKKHINLHQQKKNF